jgi:hypothetical protein
LPLQISADGRRPASSAYSAGAERLLRRMICRWLPPTIEVLGTSRVSLVSVLLVAAILAAGGQEIGVGVGTVYQVERVVIRDELC